MTEPDDVNPAGGPQAPAPTPSFATSMSLRAPGGSKAAISTAPIRSPEP
jgi:hypothetical protein